MLTYLEIQLNLIVCQAIFPQFQLINLFQIISTLELYIIIMIRNSLKTRMNHQILIYLVLLLIIQMINKYMKIYLNLIIPKKIINAFPYNNLIWKSTQINLRLLWSLYCNRNKSQNRSFKLNIKNNSIFHKKKNPKLR